MAFEQMSGCGTPWADVWRRDEASAGGIYVALEIEGGAAYSRLLKLEIEGGAALFEVIRVQRRDAQSGGIRAVNY